MTTPYREQVIKTFIEVENCKKCRNMSSYKKEVFWYFTSRILFGILLAVLSSLIISGLAALAGQFHMSDMRVTLATLLGIGISIAILVAMIGFFAEDARERLRKKYNLND